MLSPGHYEHPEFQQNPISFTRGSREAYYYVERTPAPDHYYTTEEREGRHGFSFGTKICTRYQTDSPGPGAYNLLLPRRTDQAFAQSRKGNIFGLRAEMSPGPGAYETNPSPEKKGLKFTRAKRLVGERAHSPAPGEYETGYSSLKD